MGAIELEQASSLNKTKITSKSPQIRKTENFATEPTLLMNRNWKHLDRKAGYELIIGFNNVQFRVNWENLFKECYE